MWSNGDIKGNESGAPLSLLSSLIIEKQTTFQPAFYKRKRRLAIVQLKISPLILFQSRFISFFDKEEKKKGRKRDSI